MDSDLRYPIGRFERRTTFTDAERAALIDALGAAPGKLRDAVRGLDNARLDTPYRPGGWTVRQVIHHLPDSHLNGYMRFKLALTESEPTIKPYDEAKWAELPDSRSHLVEQSLAMFDALHARWVLLLNQMAPGDFARTFIHPERGDEPQRLDWELAVHAWHGRHHVAHVTELRRRMGWD